MVKGVKTLGEFIIDSQKDFPAATGDFTKLLSAIRLAAKIVHREISQAGLVDILGNINQKNIQGETQTKLDVFANEQFISAIKGQKAVCGIGSEEMDHFISTDDDQKSGKYIFLMDPLDGSSNIDVNISIGSIFSIYKKIGTGNISSDDFLQKGTQQIAAGYVIYGPSTMLVFTTGNGVNGFTLDPSIGVFCLTHPNISIPNQDQYYSVNESNMQSFSEGMQQYINYLKDPLNGQGLQSRYIGSLVADFHRNLLKGGVYIYPSSSKYPDGKLRLQYECNPLAFIIEQAGGKASNGQDNILNVKPSSLHQRSPFIIGSKDLVTKAENYLRKYQNEYMEK